MGLSSRAFPVDVPTGARRHVDVVRPKAQGAAGGHHGRLFLIHAYLGNRSTAIELIEQPRSELPVLGRANTATSWGLAAAAVEGLTVVDEDEQAAVLYDTTVDLGTNGSLVRSWDYRLVATLQGMSAVCGRYRDRTEAHFEDALRIARVPEIVTGRAACSEERPTATSRSRCRGTRRWCAPS